MNAFQKFPVADAGVQSRTDPHSRETERPASNPGPIPTKPTRRTGRRVLATGALLLLGTALGVGFWQHSRLHAQVMATAEQRRDFVPSERTASVRVSAGTMAVTWPGTTKHSSRPISMPGQAGTSRGARSISAAASKRDSYSSRSPPPNSSIRSRRRRERWRRCRPRSSRQKPIAILPRSLGIATIPSFRKAGSPCNKATPIA